MARTTVIISLKLEDNQEVAIPLARVKGADGGEVINPRWARAMARQKAGTWSTGEIKLRHSGFAGANAVDLPTAVTLTFSAPASGDLISLVAMQTLVVATKTAEANVELEVAVTVDDGQ